MRVIGFDRRGLRSAPGEVFLDDHRHVITGLVTDNTTTKTAVTGKLTDTRTAKTRTFDLKFPRNSGGLSWSPDGQDAAFERLADNYLTILSGDIIVIDTQTGAERKVVTVKNTYSPDALRWAEY